MSSEQQPLIRFEDVSFRYDSQTEPTLKHLNLEINKGEKVLILGPSGSGKSTFGQCLNGLIPNQFKGELTGTCSVDQQVAGHASVLSLSRVIGSVLQDSDAQFVGLSVGEDIAYALENQAMPRKEMLKKVYEAAQTVNMEDYLDRLPFDLSGGQKQRVAVAGVLHGNIDVLLFDEPLASLDPHMGEVMMDLIDRLNHELGKTVIIIEHRLEDVLRHPVDRVILINEGTILYNGKIDPLLASDLLVKTGIREPLYLSALKRMYDGLHQDTNLDSLETINLEPYRKQTINKVPVIATRPLGEALITLENIRFDYDQQALIRIDHLTIRKGERISLIGENGAGKTTLSRLLTGVLRPQQGVIRYQGEDLAILSIKEIAERIGVVMQNPNQMIVKSFVKEEVMLGPQLHGFGEAEVQERMETVLKLSGLYEMRNWPISALSYGQKKRLTVAVVLALSPQALILDEPTAGQDYAHYREIMAFVDQLNKEKQTTVIFITHDMHLALEYTDRALVMADGRIIADRPSIDALNDETLLQKASLKQTSIFRLAEKLGQPVDDFVRQFIAHEREVTE